MGLSRSRKWRVSGHRRGPRVSSRGSQGSSDLSSGRGEGHAWLGKPRFSFLPVSNFTPSLPSGRHLYVRRSGLGRAPPWILKSDEPRPE